MVCFVRVRKAKKVLTMVDRLYERFGISKDDVLLWYNRRINGFVQYTGGNLLAIGQESCVILRLATLNTPGFLNISDELYLMENDLIDSD